MMGGGKDQIKWMLTSDRKFTVRSLYLFFGKICLWFSKFLWKTKVPSKIKIFRWLMTKRNILTKQNLLRRGWKGGKSCVYYGHDESIDYLFFQCFVASPVWSLMKCAFAHNLLLLT